MYRVRFSIYFHQNEFIDVDSRLARSMNFRWIDVSRAKQIDVEMEWKTRWFPFVGTPPHILLSSRSYSDFRGSRHRRMQRIVRVPDRMRIDYKGLDMVQRLDVIYRWLRPVEKKYLKSWNHVNEKASIYHLLSASSRSRLHSTRCVHSCCSCSTLRWLHSTRFDSSASSSRVRIETPRPHVLLHGDQSLHCVTGHIGSGTSMLSIEHSGFIHFSFSTAT